MGCCFVTSAGLLSAGVGVGAGLGLPQLGLCVCCDLEGLPQEGADGWEGGEDPSAGKLSPPGASAGKAPPDWQTLEKLNAGWL